MTSSLDSISSESPDVNISSWVNLTTEETGTQALPSSVSSKIPMIVRVTMLLIINVFGLFGNAFTLITIRLTPRLWTKTNFILASMLAADVMTAVIMFWYTSFILVVYVFNNPCRYNVVITALTPLMKITVIVSIYHLIVISVERYIAIVYPLHYETKFTDRTMKWSIFAAWVAGIVAGLSFAFWLINADHRKCVLIPDQYQLVDVFIIYIPVCISMVACYGKILAISLRQRRLIQPINPSVQTTSFATTPSVQNSFARCSDNVVDPKDHPMAAQPNQAVTSGSSSVELSEQQRQKIKSRRREFKAVYLTAAVVGTFVILWFPHMLGRVLALVGYNLVVINYISLAGGAIGSFNFSFNWALYAVMSKSYRRAYRQNAHPHRLLLLQEHHAASGPFTRRTKLVMPLQLQ